MTLVYLENFPNYYIGILFTISFLIILTVELRIFSKQRLAGGFSHDRMSLLFILIGVALSLFSFFLFPYLGIGKLNTNFIYFGIFVMISGFILRQWSIQILGRLFTPVISVQKNHKLVIKGPYKYVRHPSYSGLLMELLGASLAVFNWLSFILTFCFMLPPLIYRIKAEEKELIKQFGQSYIDYKKKTKMLIP